MDRGGWKPNVEISPNCPRCGSSHTKFCYYNNYSLTQPRYFCKGCRRYWTKGGSLRNVPVGGGCRKNRRGNSNNNNKSLRLSSNQGIVHSRSLDDLINNNKHDHDHFRHDRASQDDHSHSSTSSHIDLAVVYANFLNPQPDSKPVGSDDIPAELPCEFDPSALDQLTSLEANNFCENDQFMYYHELGPALQKHQDNDKAPQSFSPSATPNFGPSIISNTNTISDGLPPLPGDDHLEAVSQGMLWPDDDNDHSFPMIQQPLLGLESHHQDPDHLLFGNWSPFQFSR